MAALTFAQLSRGDRLNASFVDNGDNTRNTIGYVTTDPTTPYAPTPSTVTTKRPYYILWDCTAGAKVLDLPLAADSNGVVFTVKKTDATANSITLDPNGAELIDGLATFDFSTPNWAISVVCNGTAWFVI